MGTTRRHFIQGTVAVATIAGAPAILRAQTEPTKQKTLRAVMQGDLRSFDPIWTSASITEYHGLLIYDTLFGVNEAMKPQPQMVGKYGVSDDKLTWTFQLRDGLRFTDGSAVTSADCVASYERLLAGNTSEQFQRLMADHGVTCSMSRSGNVWDNAAMESFFSSLKTAHGTQNVSDAGSGQGRRVRLHRTILQRQTQALDNRLYEPRGVRNAGRISLGPVYKVARRRHLRMVAR